MKKTANPGKMNRDLLKDKGAALLNSLVRVEFCSSVIRRKRRNYYEHQ
jgi:hypothetical protein